MFAVMASNIHWHWTPNGYLANTLGISLAFLNEICNQIATLLAAQEANRTAIHNKLLNDPYRSQMPLSRNCSTRRACRSTARRCRSRTRW
jgi:hypothetical protein